MTPAIGITTQFIRKAKWYKYVHEFGFDAVEINRLNSKLHFNLYFLEKVKKYMQSYDVSVHSGTAGIFQAHEAFTQANLAILMAEIEVCRFLGARQFVFHLNNESLTPDNRERLQEVISSANEAGVHMLYESDSTLRAEHALEVLDAFPRLGYVLDLGHLNNGHGTGKLGCSIDQFVRRVRDRVVYIHASNNSGRRDDHNGLENGTLDWRHALDLLDLSRVSKIIIEVRHAHMVERSARELTHYLADKFHPRRHCANG